MKLVIYFIILLATTNVSASKPFTYIDRSIRIVDKPEFQLCKDMKAVVGDGGIPSIYKNEGGRLIKEMDRYPHRPLGTDKVSFHNKKTRTFYFLRENRTVDYPFDYYILDINNDREKDFFAITSGGQSPYGEGSWMEIYNHNLELLSQPIDSLILRDVKLRIGTSIIDDHIQPLVITNNVGDIRIMFYYIYTFEWQRKNYLLFQRSGWDGDNELPEKDNIFYVVAELNQDYQMVTHCLYVNKLK